MLAPIYGSVIKLLNRWTQTLADRLDASVSSRAPSSTALSNATWTDTRAGKLDSLDAAVTSRASATYYTAVRAEKLDNLDAAVTATTRIKSIQRGTIAITTTNTTATATITSVATAKTRLRFLGAYTGFGASNWCVGATLSLTNSTTITATRIVMYGVSGTHTVSWELTEFY